MDWLKGVGCEDSRFYDDDALALAIFSRNQSLTRNPLKSHIPNGCIISRDLANRFLMDSLSECLRDYLQLERPDRPIKIQSWTHNLPISDVVHTS